MSYAIDSQYSGNMKTTEASFRVVAGIALILAVIDMAITNGLNLSYPMLIGSYVALTGVASWDPIYAFLNSVFTKSNTEQEFAGNLASTPV